MTRYDQHPQAHDDARTTPHGFTGADLSDFRAPEAPVGEVAAERLSEPRTVIADDGEGEPTLWVDLGIRGLVPVLRRCDMRPATRHLWPLVPASQVPGVPREALEELADEWRYKGEFGWGPWQTGEGPDQEGWLLDQAATRLRAVLAAHPADAPAEGWPVGSPGKPWNPTLGPDAHWHHVHKALDLPTPAQAPMLDAAHPAPEPADPGMDVVAESVVRTWVEPDSWGQDTLWYLPEPDSVNPQPVIRRHELNPLTRHLWPLVPHQAVAEIERRHDDEYDRALAERDRARARVAELEAVIERAERAEAAWEKWQDRAAERDTSAGLREALERLLEFPNWTYIDGELTAVLLPEDLRAVLAAHPADVDEARAALEADNARLTEERDEARAGWQRMSDYGDYRGARVAELEAEVERLRVTLGNGQAAVDWFESELESVRGERDWFESELESVRGERNEAEARARRAEDALQRVRELADRWHSYAARERRTHDRDPKMLWRIAAQRIHRALADQTSEHDCSTCTDCLHDGQRCCGCYDGACCQTNKRCPKGTDHDNECIDPDGVTRTAATSGSEEDQ